MTQLAGIRLVRRHPGQTHRIILPLDNEPGQQRVTFTV